jgi:hypothetical protein
LAGFIVVPREAEASFISHTPKELSGLEQGALETLQIAFENELVTERLSELGLTKEEVIQRLNRLNPDEREIVLRNLDNLHPGGGNIGQDLLETLIILISVALVLLLLLPSSP